MLDKEQRDRIAALIKREVIPAIGCTEPIAVALCVAKATETLGTLPETIDVKLSGNMLKNAMGVGIPGTGMSGLPIAVALGALVGKSEYQLEVLRDSTPEYVEKGKAYIEENRINISLKENIEEKLYIEVTVKAGNDTTTAVISGGHTHFVSIVRNDEVLLSSRLENSNAEEEKDEELNLRIVYEFATTSPIEEIRFINEARKLNEEASRKSLEGNYGHELGKTLSRPLGRGIMGDSMFSHILSATSSACDARMAGAMIPVMSNSGSGNQGIAATMPVVVFGEENHNTEEEITRALALSHIKHPRH